MKPVLVLAVLSMAAACLAVQAVQAQEASGDTTQVLPRAAGMMPPMPPPEAFKACEGIAANTACSVTFGERTVAGTCLAPPGLKLACVPNDMPPPPGSTPPGN